LSNSTSTPSKTYDLDYYRRLKKRKRLFNRLLVLLLVLTVLLFVYCIAETIIIKAEAEREDLGRFPISLTGEEPTDLLAGENMMFVLGDDKILGYSSSARKEADIVHNMSHPAFMVQKDRLFTYDTQGYSWQVSVDQEVLHSEVTTNQIIDACMNENGQVAVLTFEDRFYGSLSVYNKEFSCIYKYSESQNYITGFEFLDDRHGLLVAQTLSGLSIDSVLTGLDFTKDTETKMFTTVLEDTLVYAVKVQDNGGAVLVSDRGIHYMDPDGAVTATVLFQTKLRFINNDGLTPVVAIENMEDVNHTTLYAIDKDGSISDVTTVDSILTDLYCDSTGVVYLDHDRIVTLDYHLNQTGIYQNTAAFVQVVRYRGNLFGMSTELLSTVDVKGDGKATIKTDLPQEKTEDLFLEELTVSEPESETEPESTPEAETEADTEKTDTEPESESVPEESEPDTNEEDA